MAQAIQGKEREQGRIRWIKLSYGLPSGLSDEQRKKFIEMVTRLEANTGIDIPDSYLKNILDESFTISEAYDELMDYIQEKYPDVYIAITRHKPLKPMRQGPSEAKSGKLKLKFKKPEEEKKEEKIVVFEREAKRPYRYREAPPYEKPVASRLGIPIRSRRTLYQKYINIVRRKPRVQLINYPDKIPDDKPVELRLKPPSENIVEVSKFLENMRLPEDCEATRVAMPYGESTIKIICDRGEDAKKIAYAYKQYFLRAYAYE